MVDDYRDCAGTLVALLGSCGFDAHTYYSTEAAAELAALLHPRVIVVEPTMSGRELDGDQLATLLRQGSSPQPPLLVAFTTAGQPQASR